MKRALAVLLITLASGCASPEIPIASLIDKYLPGYALSAEDQGGSSPTYVLVAPEGNVVRGVGWQELRGLTVTETKGDEYMGSPKLNTLLREKKIRITSRKQALEVARLITVLVGRDMFTKHKHWKHRVKRVEDGWLMTTEYVGPPSNIPAYGPYELLVGPNDEFIELRERQFDFQ
jgi:hypothetical protein